MILIIVIEAQLSVACNYHVTLSISYGALHNMKKDLNILLLTGEILDRNIS